MQLCSRDSPCFTVGCMCKITYDSFSGYVSGKGVIEENLENSLRSLSLISNNYRSESIFENTSQDSQVVTARDTVLRKCGQAEPMPFEACYTEILLRNCQKIGEGVYGEVFLYRNAKGGTTVMKIIPIEGDQIVNGERQKKFEEILSEVVIAMELSSLRNNRKNQTSTFSEVQKIQCVQGKYTEKLLDLWDLYDETRGSENDSPEIFKDDQLYIVLEMTNGGKDLEEFVFSSASQVYSMFKQVACALAVAEEELEFEHRDLHWGNILLTNVDKSKSITCKLNGREIVIDSRGIEATIIDFTMSRISCGGAVTFSDLARDLTIFTADGDYQFDIYRLMQKKNGNNWRNFEPFTNILWLHYILDKAVKGLRYKSNETKMHKEYIYKLNLIKNDILNYNSSKDFVNSYF